MYGFTSNDIERRQHHFFAGCALSVPFAALFFLTTCFGIAGFELPPSRSAWCAEPPFSAGFGVDPAFTFSQRNIRVRYEKCIFNGRFAKFCNCQT